MSTTAFFAGLGFPPESRLDKRIFKKMVVAHGDLTGTDKRTFSNHVTKLVWRYTLKASTVQVRPYEDEEREYLEVAVVEAVLSDRKRAARIAETIQRAIPYPTLLVLSDEAGLCVSVAHKRLSRAEKGRIVASGFLMSGWTTTSASSVDRAFQSALKLQNLSHADFLALYGDMMRAVLAHACAALSGRFVVDPKRTDAECRALLERCHGLQREVAAAKVAIHKEEGFAEQVALSTRIKELVDALVEAKARL